MLERLGVGEDLRSEGAVGQFATGVGAPAVSRGASELNRQLLGPLDSRTSWLPDVAGDFWDSVGQRVSSGMTQFATDLRGVFTGQTTVGTVFEGMASDLRERIEATAKNPLIDGLSAIFRGEAPSADMQTVADAYRMDQAAIDSQLAEMADQVNNFDAEQAALEDRLRAEIALAGVPGFIKATMSRNIENTSAGNTVTLPFDAVEGVSKGARLLNGLVYLDSPGTWIVSGMVHARGTSAAKGLGADDETNLFVDVTTSSPNVEIGRSTYTHQVDLPHGTNAATLHFTFPVTVPEKSPEWADDAQFVFLRFRAKTGRRRYLDGGIRYTNVTAILHDNRTGELAPLEGVG
ncbi:hypothetical protein [Corynebacterium sp. H113]|uniref:hypothetical protein n=1 Tax=Corynebacterium sp. H113 TaxID=3133419 RepID=UPI00309632EF